MPFNPTISANIREATALAQIASLSRVAIMVPHAFTKEFSTPISDISEIAHIPASSDAYKAVQAALKGAGSRTLPVYLARVAMDSVEFTPEIADNTTYEATFTVYNTATNTVIIDQEAVTHTTGTGDPDPLGDIAAVIQAAFPSSECTTALTATGITIAEGAGFQLVINSVSENFTLEFASTTSAAQAFEDLMSENSEDWYRLTSTIRDVTWVKDMADVIEATESSDTPKIFRTSTNAIECLSVQTDPSNSADILGVLEDGNYRRTTGEWHDQSAEIFPEMTHEAWVGSYREGTKGTAFNQGMSVPAARHPVLGRLLTKAEAGYITDRNATVRFKEFGLIITKTGKNGTSARGQGQWIQNVVISDWTKLTMIQRGLTLLVNADNAGDPITFAQRQAKRMANTLNSVLEDGVNFGLFTGYEPVTIPEVFPFADQATRTLDGLEFKAFLAGAVNFVVIDGVLTYLASDIEV